MPDAGFGFEQQVAPGGYAWWYIDGISDDGRHAVTVIAFIGSVFSPYYHWSGRRDPANHCAINVALYGGGNNRWAMTERGRASLARTARSFRLGASALTWTGDGSGGELIVEISETAAPLPWPIRGRLRLRFGTLGTTQFALDPAGRHHWRPVEPLAAITAEFDNPKLSWRGSGYCDTNWGDEPLEAGFRSWSWSRARLGDDAAILYDTLMANGEHGNLAIRIDRQGAATRLAAPPLRTLPSAPVWRMGREARSDGQSDIRVIRTLEDTPFYARSLIETRILGEPTLAMHESLSLERLRLTPVRLMLPFRMPRITRKTET